MGHLATNQPPVAYVLRAPYCMSHVGCERTEHRIYTRTNDDKERYASVRLFGPINWMIENIHCTNDKTKRNFREN